MSKSVLKIVISLSLILIVLCAIFVGAHIVYNMASKTQEIKDIFEEVEEKEALVSEYIVYGTHLNIKGNLKLQNTDIKSASLEFKTANEETSEEVKLSYTNTEDGIEFSTSDLINEGIDLEKITPNTYYILLKIGYVDDTYKYYTLKDSTAYENKEIEYYTITKNGKNNKINIRFCKAQ